MMFQEWSVFGLCIVTRNDTTKINLRMRRQVSVLLALYQGQLCVGQGFEI